MWPNLASLCLFCNRNMPWYRHQDRRQHCHGSYCQPGIGSGGGWHPHRQGDCPLHSYHHWRGRLPRCVLLHHRLYPRLLLAGCCHLLDRYHRGQRARGSPGHCYCKLSVCLWVLLWVVCVFVGPLWVVCVFVGPTVSCLCVCGSSVSCLCVCGSYCELSVCLWVLCELSVCLWVLWVVCVFVGPLWVVCVFVGPTVSCLCLWVLLWNCVLQSSFSCYKRNWKVFD